MTIAMFSTAKITNSVIAANSSATMGGGLYATGGTTYDVINCTIADKQCVVLGRRTAALHRVDPHVANSIIYNNASSPASSEVSGTPTIIYSYTTLPWTGDGNLDAAGSGLPLFVDSPSGDYHLQPHSPCVNAGTHDDPSFTAPSGDLDGNARPFPGGGEWDMGAYESQVLGPPPPPDLVEATEGDAVGRRHDEHHVGLGLDVEGDLAVIGDHLHTHSSETTNGDGSLYVYREVAGKWQFDQEITPTAGLEGGPGRGRRPSQRAESMRALMTCRIR